MVVERLCSLIGKNSGEGMYKFIRTLTSGAGKETLTLEGKAVERLPECLRSFTQGLKKPKVTICSKSSSKGTGLFGVRINDGNSTVNAFAYGVDTTRGAAPIVQIRGRSFANGQKTEGFSSFFNPNIELSPRKCGSVNIKKPSCKTFELYTENGEVASAYHYNGSGSGIISKVVDPKDAITKPSEFNKAMQTFNDFWKRKGKENSIVNSCEKELLQIAQSTKKPSVRFVTKAKDALLKQMGYESELLPVKCLSDEKMMGGAAAFDPVNGKLLVNKEVLAKCNNKELVLLLAHELQHVDDCVKLAKSIGLKNFQKLYPQKVNNEFYNKMMQRADTVGFSPKEFVDEIKGEALVSKYKGEYARILKATRYDLSIAETSARGTERDVMDLFRKKGIKLTAEGYPLEVYGRESSSWISPLLKKVERRLPKEGRDKVFNEEYSAALKKIEPELYEIDKKLSEGLPSEEFKELRKRAQEIIKQKYKEERTLVYAVLTEMANKLCKS